MSIPVTCPCGVRGEVLDGAAGRPIRCRNCKRLLTVPAAAPAGAGATGTADGRDGPAVVRPAPGRQGVRILVAGGLVAALGLLALAAAATVVALAFLPSRHAPDPVAEGSGEVHPAPPSAAGDAEKPAPAADKILGPEPDTSLTQARREDDKIVGRPPAPGGALPLSPTPPEATPELPRPPGPNAVPPNPAPPEVRPKVANQMTFLNITAAGRRFCILADNSGSMSRGPIEQVKRELINTLDALAPESQFYVIFFNAKADPMPFESWLRGTPEDVKKVLPWIEDKSAGGGTRPLPAFERAFQLRPRPDVIFFLTDGIIPVKVPDEVVALNNEEPKVKINTILFEAGDEFRRTRFPKKLERAEAQLRKIAEDSGGTFRRSAGDAGGPEPAARPVDEVTRLVEAANRLPAGDPQLRRVTSRLLALLGKAAPEARSAILAALRKANNLDASDLPALIALLEAPGEDVLDFALHSFVALGANARDAVAPLRRLARDAKPEVQLAVALVVYQIAGADPSLAEVYRTHGLKSKSGPVRRASLAALHNLGAEALPSRTLFALAFDDPAPEVRQQGQDVIAERMGKAEEKDLPEVRALLKRKSPVEAVRLGLRGVSRLGPKAGECLPEVLEAFAGDDADLRREAVPALRALGPAARPAVAALTARLPRQPPERQRETALVLAAVAPSDNEVVRLIARPLVEHLHPDALPGAEEPPEVLLLSIRDVGAPTVELIFAALEGATGKRGAVAANHRRFLFRALERLGPVAYSEERLRTVSGYTSRDKEVFEDVRGAAARARRAMTP